MATTSYRADANMSRVCTTPELMIILWHSSQLAPWHGTLHISLSLLILVSRSTFLRRAGADRGNCTLCSSTSTFACHLERG